MISPGQGGPEPELVQHQAAGGGGALTTCDTMRQVLSAVHNL